MVTYKLLIPALVLICSCGAPTRMAHLPDKTGEPQGEVIQQSLFNSPESTISEEDIGRLLEGEILIGNSVRIAVFNYSQFSQGNYYQMWNDEEFLKTQQDYVSAITSEIKIAEKIDRIILMPSIMANDKSSITNLRETAIRLQADLLLVYAIKSDTYYKYKAFTADEVKAFATIETFLMDTRTGLIPFTTIATKEAFLKKSKSETTTEELQKRTEKEAVIKALTEIGNELTRFLGNG